MPNYDTTYVDSLRKILKSMSAEEMLSPLRVTLEDLLLSETRGRWWVVGSAWTGASLAPSSGAKLPTTVEGKTQSIFTASFMKLAENMRITRAPKINILFALTVGSENNTEAFNSLLALSLQPTQEKEIFDVMLFCVQKMKAYRSFYSLVCQDLCNYDNKYKRHLQHSLWDKFSDFDALKNKELKNLGHLIVDIIKSDILNMSVLKTLPFADTNKKIVNFLESILISIFDAKEGCHVSEHAFGQLFKSPKLKTFRIQIRMFISLFIIPNLDKKIISPTSELFRKRVDHVLDVLAADQGALL